MRPCVGILGLGLAACQAAPPVDDVAQPVLGAMLSTTDPAVVALLGSGGNVFCTGTLVSPRVVLTAGHCIDDAMGNVTVFFGDFAGGVGDRYGADRTASHPMWTGSISNGNDVGVILLSVSQDPALAVPMNTTSLDASIGADYRVVGFGIHDRDTGELDGYKRTALMRIQNLTGDYVEVTDPDPATLPETAICQGDSGGPGFITVGGVEVLAGVHSYSIVGCFNPSGDSRVDLLLPEFVQAWIDANDPTCREDGLCVRVGCSADPDCLPCGADGTCASGCALPDPDCPTQALGEICRANSQCMSGMCIGWTLDPRVKFCTQPCALGCPADMPCGNHPPLGQVCYYDHEPPGALGQACAAPTDCAEYLCEDGACTYTCSVPQGRLCASGFTCADHGSGARCYGVPVEDGGGCSTGGGGAGLVVVLVLGFVLRRRR